MKLFLLISLLLITSTMNAQPGGEFLDDGTAVYLQKLLASHGQTGSILQKQSRTKPFVVGLFGWKALQLSQLPFNKIEGQNIKICRLALSIYERDEKLAAVLTAMENRPVSNVSFVEATEDEKNSLQKLVVQRYTKAYLFDLDRPAGPQPREADPLAAWKYNLGADLGQLAGKITQWFSLTPKSGFDRSMTSDLEGLDRDLTNIPGTIPETVVKALRALRATASQGPYAQTQKTEVAASLARLLDAALVFVDIPPIKPEEVVRPPAGPRPTPPAASKTAEQYFQSGKALAGKGEHERAVAEFTEAVRLDGSNGEVFFWRASSYEKLGRYQSAIDDYNKMITLRYNLSTAFFNRGTDYYFLKKYEASVSDITAAIGLDRTNAGRFYNRGLSYFELGNYDKAYNDFAEAARLAPNRKEYFISMGKSACKQGLLMTAINAQDKANALGAKVTRGCSK